MRVNQLVIRSGVHLLFALASLSVFVGAASVALQQSQTDTIDVSDPRPLASVIDELENRWGWVITYEDPRYIYASDFEV